MSERLDEAREALERIHDYFDQRADAEATGDPATFHGNREMYLRRDAETVQAALASARAEGAREAFEKAARRLDEIAGREPNMLRQDTLCVAAMHIRSLAKEANES